MTIDVALVTTFLPTRETHKLIAVDPIGDYRASGFVIAGSLSSRWRF